MKIKKSGFTLLELIVVITIVAIMAGISIWRLMDRYDIELLSAANTLQAALVRTRDLARAPKQDDDITVEYDVNGIGIFFPSVDTPNIEFKVFKDKIPKNISPNVYDSGDVIISTTRFSELNLGNIKISAPTNLSSIIFTSSESPVKEAVYYTITNVPVVGHVTTKLSAGSNLTITLSHVLDAGKTRNVIIESSGNIKIGP